jgi:transposase, IS6 family
MPPPGWDRWFVDETYVQVAGRWRDAYRAIDQSGQVVDVLVSRSKTPRRRVASSSAATYPAGVEELLPAAWHCTEQDANNRVEADHGRLKSQLRPMRGLKQLLRQRRDGGGDGVPNRFCAVTS